VPQIASAISGKTYRFAENALDIRSFSLSFRLSTDAGRSRVDTRGPNRIPADA
jgi:hypothetical protein